MFDLACWRPVFENFIVKLLVVRFHSTQNRVIVENWENKKTVTRLRSQKSPFVYSLELILPNYFTDELNLLLIFFVLPQRGTRRPRWLVVYFCWANPLSACRGFPSQRWKFIAQGLERQKVYTLRLFRSSFYKRFHKNKSNCRSFIDRDGQSYKYQVRTVDFRGHFHNELNVDLVDIIDPSSSFRIAKRFFKI